MLRKPNTSQLVPMLLYYVLSKKLIGNMNLFCFVLKHEFLISNIFQVQPLLQRYIKK